MATTTELIQQAIDAFDYLLELKVEPYPNALSEVLDDRLGFVFRKEPTP